MTAGMTAGRRLSLALLAVGLGLGAGGDCLPERSVPRQDGRYLMAVDLHVHAFFGDGAIAPWNLGREARRRGLDAIAVTNHNQVFAARLTRWWSRLSGGPVVLVGQEVTNPGYHIVAAGLERAVDWRGPPGEVVDAAHRQGGVAIAAHPFRPYWPSFDGVVPRLDGAELCHPRIFSHPDVREELAGFFAQTSKDRPPGRPLAAIGSSDFHHLSLLGHCRTLVLADEVSERGVLDAIRAGRTTAIPESEAEGRGLPPAPQPRPRASGVLLWLGLLGLILFAGRR